MSENKEEQWDGEDTRKLIKANVLRISILACFGVVALVVYNSLTSAPTSDDAKLAYIKHDFDQAMSYIDKIDNGDDDSEKSLADQIKAKIYLTPESGFYDQVEAFNILSSLFNDDKSVERASKLYNLATKLNKSAKVRSVYLSYLAQRGIGDSKNELVDLYLSSKVPSERAKAYPLLKMMPESVDRNIKLANYLVNDVGGKNSLMIASALLKTASSMGSSESELNLAYIYLKMLNSDNGANSEVLSTKFASSVNQAISMGYRGNKLQDIYNIFYNGTYGISPNRVFALRVKNMISGNQNG
ncbi:hypothetical protein [Photobacterium kishitanii]|nr:hypothetical protein [Photobacterium kishitanii]